MSGSLALESIAASAPVGGAAAAATAASERSCAMPISSYVNPPTKNTNRAVGLGPCHCHRTNVVVVAGNKPRFKNNSQHSSKLDFRRALDLQKPLTAYRTLLTPHQRSSSAVPRATGNSSGTNRDARASFITFPARAHVKKAMQHKFQSKNQSTGRRHRTSGFTGTSTRSAPSTGTCTG